MTNFLHKFQIFFSKKNNFKIISFSIFAFSTTYIPTSQAVSPLSLYSSPNNNSNNLGIFATLNHLQEKKSAFTEKESILEFESKKEFTETQIIETLENLQEKIPSLFTNYTEKNLKIEEIKNQLLKSKNNLETLKLSKTENLQEDELAEIDSKIKNQQQIINLKTDELKIIQKAQNNIKKNLENNYILLAETYKNFPKLNTNKDFIKNFQQAIENNKKDLLKFLTTQKTTLQTKQENSKKLVLKTQEELAKLEREIQQLQTTYKEYIWKLAFDLGFFIIIIISIFLFKIASLKAIERIGKKVHPQNIDTIKNIHKWFFYSLITLTILIYLIAFSKNILPFLAILGTALAFALREILISFIAWFVIEMKGGYKVGDIIKVDKVFGEVKEITSLLTIIHQHGYNGETGKTLSIPNKTIFEKSIQNWSKRRDFIYITVDFLLEADTNLEKVEMLLKEAIEIANKEFYEKAKQNLSWFQRYCKLSLPNIEAQIFFESKEEGLLLRGKIFTNIQKRHIIRNKIIKNFIKNTQKHNDINLRFIS